MVASSTAICASAWPPSRFSASGPISTMTPAKPRTQPRVLPQLSGSSRTNRWASRMVLNGTAAIRIAASPLSIWVSPQPIRTKGSMVPKAPMISSGRQ